MPPATAPFQRILVDGVPYWKDTAGILYYYESSTLPTQESKIRLGTLTEGLDAGWEERLAGPLATYRASCTSRNRLPPKAKAA